MVLQLVNYHLVVVWLNITSTKFIKTGGTSSEFLKADGSVDLNSKITTTSGVGHAQVVQTGNIFVGIYDVSITTAATLGSWTWSDKVVGTVREWTIHGLQTRTAATATTYYIRHRTNGLENMVLILPATPATIINSYPFILKFRIVRNTATSVLWMGQFSDSETTAPGNWFFTSQDKSGNIVGLNVSAAYSITASSNVGTSSLTIFHVDVQNVYA